MAEAIAKQDYQSLVNIAEETDISVSNLSIHLCFCFLALIIVCQAPNDRHPSRLLIVAPMVLGHLVRDDL